MPGAGPIARKLLEAGACPDGDVADAETPLMTAPATVVPRSYGSPRGADLTATASASAGGVSGGTALRHAAAFGMSDVVDVLLAAGANDLVQAAAAGNITALLTTGTPQRERVASLRWQPSTGGWESSISYWTPRHP